MAKIVKFKDGRYGVRKRVWFFWFKYKSMYGDSWWPSQYKLKAYCKGTLEQCKAVYCADKGEVFNGEGQR